MAWNLWLRPSSSRLHCNIKPDIAYRGEVGSSFQDSAGLPHPTPLRNDNTPAPCPHGGQGSAIPYTSRGLNPRHREEERRSDPFMTDLRKIYFPKNIHFIPNYLPDSKRQQTTTVDYKRLFNGLILTRVASL